MSKCKHKRLVLATANLVEFEPDQEPFVSGKIECAGISRITVSGINIHYCPLCQMVHDIAVESAYDVDETFCTSDDSCNGHD